MTTEADFIAALDAEPDSHVTRLAFADWLEERGDWRAEGYRALGNLGMVPCHLRPCQHSPEYDHWMWQLLPWNGRRPDSYTFDANSTDWTIWFRRFCPRLFGAHFGRFDGGRKAAEFAAAVSFVNLPFDVRAALLAPTPTEARA